MEAKRQAEELAKEDEKRQAREAEASKLTPEERELKRQQDKWRREFEREQHALA